MSTQTPDTDDRPDQKAPGKPASRQPPEANTGKGKGDDQDRDEGQDTPKTGREHENRDR